ncbi:MAG: tcyL [Anaerocolumna sp.]|jgi:L-cystine transport system permease protein|nr:tcyL [Anaerocolumna sp.]
MGPFFSLDRVFEYFPIVLRGFPVTVKIVLVATAAGLTFGTLLAFIRIYKVPVLNQLVLLYISFVRGTPQLVQLFIILYGLPLLVLKVTGININRWDKLFFVLVTYSLNEAAFFSEYIRAAILAVPKGQTEAGYSVGLTGSQTFFRIILPQAARIALPGLGTSFIYLFQGTSLAYLIGILDIMGQVNAIGARTHHFIEGYVCAGIIFIIISVILEKVLHRANERLAYGAAR